MSHHPPRTGPPTLVEQMAALILAGIPREPTWVCAARLQLLDQEAQAGIGNRSVAHHVKAVPPGVLAIVKRFAFTTDRT